MHTIKFKNGTVIQVACPNKSGISTVTDILGYPFFGDFRARNGRSELLKSGQWIRTENYSKEWIISKKIAVLRDPVSRTASCFADRVLKKNRNGSRDKIPSFDYFVKNLKDIQEKFPDIKIHSETQIHWVGTDPSQFDYVFNTKQLSHEFTNVISELSGVSIPNTSHRKSSRGLSRSFEITEEHKRLIKEFYADEYKYWSNYFQ
jgi:hypothetical protein